MQSVIITRSTLALSNRPIGSRVSVRASEGENGVEHCRGNAAGERVLLTWVVTADEQHFAPPVRSGPRFSSRTSAPWPNAGRGRGRANPHWPSTGHIACQANPPRQTITRSSAATRRSSATSHGAHVSRSAGSGLLSGGAHRTAATIRASTRRWPSPGATLVGFSASRTGTATRKGNLRCGHR